MRIFSLLTEKETFWLNLGHVTRGAQGGPSRDQPRPYRAFGRSVGDRQPRRSAQAYKSKRTSKSNTDADPSAMTHDVTSAVLLPRVARCPSPWPWP